MPLLDWEGSVCLGSRSRDGPPDGLYGTITARCAVRSGDKADRSADGSSYGSFHVRDVATALLSRMCTAGYSPLVLALPTSGVGSRSRSARCRELATAPG